jgi:hypothetical protein
MKHAIIIHIDSLATFLIIFRVHMNVLFIVKVKILVLIKWSYSAPGENYFDY